jgi:hemerythrin superfamily protein
MPRPTNITGKAAGKMKAMKHGLEGHGGIMKKLAEEHGEVSMLLEKCSRVSDPEKRRELFSKIREELLSHAKGEEKIFYARLKQFDESRDIVQHATEEHQEVEDMIDRLSTMGYAGDDWGELFDELKDSVKEHVKEEESEMFAAAKDVLDDDELKELEQRYLQAKNAEKQRLH